MVQSIFVSAVCAGLLMLPAAPPAAATGQTQAPMGVVVLSESARLSGASTATGSNVYAGDSLSTDPAGKLRLRIGGDGQVYLLGGSEATLTQSDRGVQVDVSRGTVGMVSTIVNPIQLNTPLGLVHAIDGQSASGQVEIIGPNELIIAAFQGDLQIDRPCESETVHGGNTYRVSIEPGAPENNKCAASYAKSGVIPALNTHLVVKLIAIGGGAALLVWLLWPKHHHHPVSPSKMADSTD